MDDSDSDFYSRILRELYSPAWLRKSGRDSYASLAKKLGVDDQTVRNAIIRMQESGFLKAWSAFVNPRALQMECASLLIDLDRNASKKIDDIILQLKLLEGTVAIFSFLDGEGLRLVIYYEDEEDLVRKVRLISSICGVNEPAALWKIPFPPSRIRLKKTDWLIIRYLLKDSRKSVSEIAKGIKVSTRTVSRRLNVMTEYGSFFLTQIADVKKIDGFLYHFVIEYDSNAKKADSDGLLRAKISRVVFADTNAEHYTIIASICQNISGAREILNWLRKLDGVKEVRANIMDDIIFVNEWINREIEKRLRN